MAAFDEAAVLAWLATVPGLTAAHRVAAAQIMAEDEYDGAELVAREEGLAAAIHTTLLSLLCRDYNSHSMSGSGLAQIGPTL
jgi:hypothetical protein